MNRARRRGMGGLALVALVALPGCGGHQPAARPNPMQGWAVHIHPADDLSTLDVRICGDPLPRRLIPGVPEAAGWTHDFRIVDGPPLFAGRDGLDVPPDTRCVRYTVDMRRAAERGSTRDAVRASPGRWMWRPDRLPDPRTLRAVLTADLGDARLSLPWPRLPDAGGAPGWRIPWNGFRYRSNAVIGRFESTRLAVPDGALDVAFLGEPRGDRARFERWLGTAAGEVATVYGRFPVPRAQVIVVFEGGSRVGFGATARGGGPGAILYVGAETSAATLAADWTATHELFHLGMPLIAREDAWLSEGVTTVYTYLAMARGGRLAASEALAELAAGFERGATWSTGRPLGEDSADMHRSGAWWRVYWGGGAWAMARSIEMARAGKRFDDVLRLWSRAASDPGPARRALALLRWADRALPGHRLTETARAALGEARFPETAPLLDAMGDPIVSDALLTPINPNR